MWVRWWFSAVAKAVWFCVFLYLPKSIVPAAETGNIQEATHLFVVSDLFGCSDTWFSHKGVYGAGINPFVSSSWLQVSLSWIIPLKKVVCRLGKGDYEEMSHDLGWRARSMEPIVWVWGSFRELWSQKPGNLRLIYCWSFVGLLCLLWVYRRKITQPRHDWWLFKLRLMPDSLCNTIAVLRVVSFTCDNEHGF